MNNASAPPSLYWWLRDVLDSIVRCYAGFLLFYHLRYQAASVSYWLTSFCLHEFVIKLHPWIWGWNVQLWLFSDRICNLAMRLIRLLAGNLPKGKQNATVYLRLISGSRVHRVLNRWEHLNWNLIDIDEWNWIDGYVSYILFLCYKLFHTKFLQQKSQRHLYLKLTMVIKTIASIPRSACLRPDWLIRLRLSLIFTMKQSCYRVTHT